jgi:hypothetical protein
MAQRLAQLSRPGEQQRLELIGGLGARLDRAAAGHPQRADRLHCAVAGPGTPTALPASAARTAA